MAADPDWRVLRHRVRRDFDFDVPYGNQSFAGQARAATVGGGAASAAALVQGLRVGAEAGAQQEEEQKGVLSHGDRPWSWFEQMCSIGGRDGFGKPAFSRVRVGRTRICLSEFPALARLSFEGTPVIAQSLPGPPRRRSGGSQGRGVLHAPERG